MNARIIALAIVDKRGAQRPAEPTVRYERSARETLIGFEHCVPIRSVAWSEASHFVQYFQTRFDGFVRSLRAGSRNPVCGLLDSALWLGATSCLGWDPRSTARLQAGALPRQTSALRALRAVSIPEELIRMIADPRLWPLEAVPEPTFWFFCLKNPAVLGFDIALSAFIGVPSPGQLLFEMVVSRPSQESVFHSPQEYGVGLTPTTEEIDHVCTYIWTDLHACLGRNTRG